MRKHAGTNQSALVVRLLRIVYLSKTDSLPKSLIEMTVILECDIQDNIK